MAIKAIQTIEATIQMRQGNEEDFDPDQMTAGEWAVSKDVKYVRMCFMPGLCLRMATYEAFEQDMQEIQLILATCQDIQAAVEQFVQLAEQHELWAETWSLTSKSWAIGSTGTRDGEDTDNSKYYSEQSKAEADRAKNEADRAAAIAGIDVDSALSETSANPVQNKVITKALKEIDVDINDKSVDFEQAENRVNIQSGETIPTLFGKIKKWLADLKPVAFSGNYSDLINRLTLTNSYLATEPGVSALDAAIGPDIDARINEINSNLQNLSNIFGTGHNITSTLITNANTFFTNCINGSLSICLINKSTLNNPINGSGIIVQFRLSSNYGTQIAIGNGDIYIRKVSEGTFSNWRVL